MNKLFNIPKLVTEKKVVPIDLIVTNPWNPNVMSGFMFEKMKKTIEEKGLFGSIIVRKHLGFYQILDGEHRYKACKELGWKELPVECSIDDVSDSDTRFWTLYFNNTKGKDDVEKVANIFEQLELGQEQLLPFTEDEIRNTKELFKFDFSKYETSLVENVKEQTNVLAFKFNNEEWKLVQKAIQLAKEENQTEKDMFMGMLFNYLQLRLGSSVGQTVITI